MIHESIYCANDAILHFWSNIYINLTFIYNTYNACRMKTRLDGFWRALIKILLFGPLYSSWKIMNFDVFEDSNGRLLMF